MSGRIKAIVLQSSRIVVGYSEASLVIHAAKLGMLQTAIARLDLQARGCWKELHHARCDEELPRLRCAVSGAALGKT
jgi:hypothetical protein